MVCQGGCDNETSEPRIQKPSGFTYEFATRVLGIIQKKQDWISRDDVMKGLGEINGLGNSTLHTYLSKAINYLQQRGCIQRKFEYHHLYLKTLDLTIDDAIAQDVGEASPAETIPDEHLSPEPNNESRIAPAPDYNKMRVIPSNFPEALIEAIDAGVIDQLWENRSALIREAVRAHLFKFGYLKLREIGRVKK